MPEFRGRGIAQEAMRLCEDMHGSENWELDTILQEPGNCHLYEKMGYRQTGRTEVINERMTLVFYEKAKMGAVGDHLTEDERMETNCLRKRRCRKPILHLPCLLCSAWWFHWSIIW